MRQISTFSATVAVAAMVILYSMPSVGAADCLEQPSRQCLLAVAGDAAARARSPVTRADLFSNTAAALAEAGDTDGARHAVAAAIAAMNEIDVPEARLSALFSIAKRQIALGFEAEAMQSLDQAATLIGDRLAADQRDTLLTLLVRLRHLASLRAPFGHSDPLAATIEQAVGTAETVPEPDMRSNLLVLIADAQSLLDSDASVRTLRHAIAAAQPIASPADRAAALMTALAAASQIDSQQLARETARIALEAALQVTRASERARLSGIIALQLMASDGIPLGEPIQNDVAECLAEPTQTCLARHAAAAAGVAESGFERAVLHLNIANIQSARNNREMALRNLAAAQSAVQSAPSSAAWLLLQTVAGQQQKLDDPQAARATLAQLETWAESDSVDDTGSDLLSKVRAFRTVAVLSADLDGETAPSWFRKAVRLAETADNAWQQATALHEIAMGQAASDRAGATETFVRAVDAAAGVEFAESRAGLLLTIADAAIEAGLPDAARTIGPDVLSAIRRFDGLTDMAPYRARLALMLLKAEQG